MINEDPFNRKIDFAIAFKSLILDLNIIIKNSISEIIEIFSRSSFIGTIEEEHIRPLIWKFYFIPNEFKTHSNLFELICFLIKNKQKNKKKLNNKKKKRLVGDPLGGDDKSKGEWKNFYKESEIKKIINLDIIRTYNDKELFQNKNIIEILTNILVKYSIENEDVSYKQGMNEICANIIIAIYPYYNINNKTCFENNSIDFNENEIKNYCENPEKYSKEIYNILYNLNTFESDVYEIFSLLMNNAGLKKFYETFDNKTERNLLLKEDYKKYDLFSFKINNNNNEKNNNNNDKIYLISKCDEIIKTKLKIIDSGLFNHFLIIDLNCSIFLQKWLKCLFSREFKINQILILWDSIFSVGKNLLFVDFLSIVILLSLKYKIIKKDQDNTFQIIFGFNQKNKINVIKFIAEAKDLMDRYYQRKNMNIPMSYYDNKSIFNNGINDDNDDDDDIDQEKPFYSGININKNDEKSNNNNNNNDNNNNDNNNNDNNNNNNNIANNIIEEENKYNNNDNNKNNNNMRKNLFGEEVPININNIDNNINDNIINNKNNINNNIDNNNSIKRQNLFNREESENKIQSKNEKNNNSNIINTKIESTKKYLSGAVSQIGSFFKDVVNKEFQKIENNNNNNNNIYYNSQEIANNVSNLEYLLNKYKNNFTEDDLNLFQYSIRFFKMSGKSFNYENKLNK